MISQKPTALENCAQMLIEVDSMLDLVKSRSSTQKIKFCPKETSQNFLMAVQILDYRINNSRPTSKNYSASRLKVIPASTLGPGQYFPHSFLKKTPVQSNLTLEYFEKPKKSIKMPLLTSRTPTKSPKEHNLKVERIVKKRLEINLINNIRKRDRFKTKMQTMHEDTKKLYSETLIRLFIPLCLVYRISENIMRKVNEKKNIVNIMKPVMRFGYRKRQEFQRTVVKHVKYILQISLIRLLQYRWLTKIRVIQCAFRKYRLIKLARLQVFYVICLKSESLCASLWPSLSNNIKYEILANFLIKTLANYSVKRCKYLYDIRMVNMKFTRNFSHWEMDALTNALGRSLTFKLPPPPKLLLYSQSQKLIEYILSETKKKMKKKALKKSLILPDKKLF